jgi:hypothetical protein
MSNITPFPVLAHIVSIIKNAISDLKIEYTTTATAILKDGNDSIYLDQRFDSSGKLATVLINDQRDIIFSEDLLPVLKNLHQGVKSGLKSELQTATIVINDLDIETRLVLETAKDAFDQLSSSYEFVKTTKKELIKVKSEFKFENHCFEVIIINEADKIVVESEFSSTIDPVIKKIIEADTFKVQQALYGIFKKDKA